MLSLYSFLSIELPVISRHFLWKALLRIWRPFLVVSVIMAAKTATKFNKTGQIDIPNISTRRGTQSKLNKLKHLKGHCHEKSVLEKHIGGCLLALIMILWQIKKFLENPSKTYFENLYLWGGGGSRPEIDLIWSNFLHGPGVAVAVAVAFWLCGPPQTQFFSGPAKVCKRNYFEQAKVWRVISFKGMIRKILMVLAALS
jgi:hypothetical protein